MHELHSLPTGLPASRHSTLMTIPSPTTRCTLWQLLHATPQLQTFPPRVRLRSLSRRLADAPGRIEFVILGLVTRPLLLPTPPHGDAVIVRQTRFGQVRSEEHTSELQSRPHLVCRLLLEKKKK